MTSHLYSLKQNLKQKKNLLNQHFATLANVVGKVAFYNVLKRLDIFQNLLKMCVCYVSYRGMLNPVYTDSSVTDQQFLLQK